jgi:hypothetical protein
LGLFAATAIAAALWLLIHARDVARTFSGRREGEIVPGPGRRQATSFAVWTGLAVFNLAWIACVLIWVYTIGGDANAVVDASR